MIIQHFVGNNSAIKFLKSHSCLFDLFKTLSEVTGSGTEGTEAGTAHYAVL
jgi:hypothetical protein